jgi:hypothetical protein
MVELAATIFVWGSLCLVAIWLLPFVLCGVFYLWALMMGVVIPLFDLASEGWGDLKRDLKQAISTARRRG